MSTITAASLLDTDVSSLIVNNKVNAIGITEFGPATNLHEIQVEWKPLVGRQIGVKIIAVSVNPVDGKIRVNRGRGGSPAHPIVLGYDGSGIVVDVGPEASLFKIGDRVWFAGDCRKNGSNTDVAVVDERIVGRMPQSLSFTKAAALPLTALTAWEGLFEEMGLVANDPKLTGKRILVLPGAGGVGVLVIQMAARLLGLYVVATASRPESVKVCEDLGANLVINHRLPLKEQLEAAGVDGVDYIYNGYESAEYFDQYAGIVKPFGKILSIVGTQKTVNLGSLFMKRVSYHWEYMFARTTHDVDVIQQHHILNKVADLVDQGILSVNTSEEWAYNLPNLIKAHELVDSGTMTGKLVLSKEIA